MPVRATLCLLVAAVACAIGAAPALGGATISGSDDDVWNATTTPTYIITGSAPGVEIKWSFRGGDSDEPDDLNNTGQSPLRITLPGLSDATGYRLVARESGDHRGRQDPAPLRGGHHPAARGARHSRPGRRVRTGPAGRGRLPVRRGRVHGHRARRRPRADRDARSAVVSRDDRRRGGERRHGAARLHGGGARAGPARARPARARACPDRRPGLGREARPALARPRDADATEAAVPRSGRRSPCCAGGRSGARRSTTSRSSGSPASAS